MPFFLLAPLAWLAETGFVVIMWFISRKGILFTVMVSIIGLVGAAISYLVSQVDTLIGSVMPAAVPFIAAFVPDNTALCVSIVISTELACTSYKLTIKLLEYKSRVFLA
ncbi:MAG: hypothetical protein RPR97_07550 [Colwellia sp.]|jgi:hypothetical protein